jgi:hypothetical protein
MANMDLGGLISELVEQRVHSILGPHMEALERISSFLGMAHRRSPGRPAGSRTAKRGPGRTGRTGRPSRSARRGGGDVAKFEEGQKVRYRQGKGEFEATVLRTDAKAGTVTVQRNKDGKRVTRPADKIYTSAA